MKVDLCIPALDIGGSERQLVGLAKSLADLGVDVHVVALSCGGPLEPELRAAGITVVCLDASTGPAGSRRIMTRPVAVASLIRYWRRRRPDAVQAWLPAAQILALPVARLLRVPRRILMLRSMASAVNMTPVTRKAFDLAVRSATDAVGNSAAVVDDPGWHVGRLRQHVITNAVAVSTEAADPSREPARGVMVANLNPHKGHLALVEALARSSTQPHVNVIGSGPMRAQLDTAIAARGLGDRVTIVEGVADPTAYLLDSQLFVLSSPSEGLPNAALEAMAAGLPVIAFAVGGIPEIVEDGVSGLLVKPGDIDGLAAAIDRAVLDPGWRARAGRAARERVQQLTWESRALQNLAVMGALGG